MAVDAFALTIAALGVGLIAFMRGAFGGGFAVIGIPLLSLAMDPIAAGALLAPLFIVIDVIALRYWKARHCRAPTCCRCCRRSSSASARATC